MGPSRPRRGSEARPRLVETAGDPFRFLDAALRRGRRAAPGEGARPARSVHLPVGHDRRGAGDRGDAARRDRLCTEEQHAAARHGRQTRPVGGGERERIRVAEEERARLVQILEATSDYVCMTDPAGTITYLNAAGRKLIGAPDSQGVGKSAGEIYPAWARELIEREGTPVASSAGAWTGETAILGADGTEIPVSQVIIAHRGPGGEIRFFSTIARDIRERKAYEARLQYLANYDPLTGLPNRDLLGDRALQAVAHARRASRPAALLVLNLDRFKLVNESYSHGAGDTLLRMVADRLKSAVREGDTVARLGGDAFAVLATDLARPDDVLSVARKIREAMRSPFRLEARDLHVTLSIGASVTPRDGEEFDMLLRNADAAMHRVKAEGRDGFQFYAAAMTRQAAERVELENELRLALEKNHLEMHYQPQVVLADGRIVGVEALMRWNHAQRGS